ncbi:zinc finger BED domain-containing protein 4-like [Eriocheir sinensis]|uniref:zinc finger BED domain-containing protein 4-like n=1 Tax=Eriocheir sinensis TaxID=95602 RepID=UPI0021C82454|nr:zinc finger BED domain-containing protein 4-like [Eriocheir sinensis]
MMRHIRTKHPIEYSELSIERPDSPPQPGPAQLGEPGPSQPGEPGPSQPGEPGPSQRGEPGSSQPGEAGSSTATFAAPRRLVQRQQTLANVITRRQAYPAESAKKKHLDSHLLKMIAIDMQPISLVENEGFKEFVKVLDPRYILPSRRELMRTHFPSLYENQVQQVRSELEGASFVTLTSDLWTSRQTKSFLSVTCHFISPEWELKSRLLATKRLMVDHTSQNIADALIEICEEWNVMEKVYCIVTDNAANMIKAVKDIIKTGHIGCFAHTLNLVVQNAIKNTGEVKEVQDKIKAIVSFFHHSVKASDKLGALQVQQGTEKKKLIIDVETRWNSTFYMLERFQEQHQAVTTALCVLGRGSMCLSSEELKTVKKSISVLHPFELVTKELSSEKITCLSKVIPMIKALRSCMSSRNDTERSELYTTFALGKELKTLLDKVWITGEQFPSWSSDIAGSKI